MKKVIETGVPINILFSSTIGEKVKKGHPGKLHPWWSRSPIVSSAALLKTALDDATQDNDCLLYAAPSRRDRQKSRMQPSAGTKTRREEAVDGGRRRTCERTRMA